MASTPVSVTPETVVFSVPASSDVEPGDTLQFVNDTTKFPDFEVVFLGDTPTGLPGPFTGTSVINIPVIEEGTFYYRVEHRGSGKHAPHSIGVFSIRSCGGGCP